MWWINTSCFSAIMIGAKFESYALVPYSEPRIDLGILSVLCKLPAPNLDNVVRVLLTEMANGENSIYDSINKFGNIDAFWVLVSKTSRSKTLRYWQFFSLLAISRMVSTERCRLSGRLMYRTIPTATCSSIIS